MQSNLPTLSILLLYRIASYIVFVLYFAIVCILLLLLYFAIVFCYCSQLQWDDNARNCYSHVLFHCFIGLTHCLFVYFNEW